MRSSFKESISYTCPEQYLFLPTQFGTDRDAGLHAEARTILVEVLEIYSHMATATPAGRHASLQLMMRAKLLCYSGTVSDLVCVSNTVLRICLFAKTNNMSYLSPLATHITRRSMLASNTPVSLISTLTRSYLLQLKQLQ